MADASTPNRTTKRLLFFYGRECPHCQVMEPLVKRAEEELSVWFEKFEVWHDAGNADMLEEHDKGYCGGVPFFFNTATKKWICGEVTYDYLKSFASAKLEA